MSYRHRNALYLRISLHTVLPLYLYLDDKHTSWMTDAILQQVVADLKPLILKKWREEEPYRAITSGPKAKKFGIVEVYRGDNYQVAYFLQKSDSHNVLIKSRYFMARPQPRYIPPPRTDVPEAGTLKTKKGTKRSAEKKPKPKPKLKPRKRKRGADTEDEPEAEASDDDGSQIDDNEPKEMRRSARSTARGLASGHYRESDDDEDEDEEAEADGQDAVEEADPNGPTEDTSRPAAKPGHSNSEDIVARVKSEPNEEGLLSLLSGTVAMDDGTNDISMNTAEDHPPADYPPTQSRDADSLIQEDDDEEKPKPDLGLRYTGYTIPDVCLTIIVEPWKSTSSRAGTREPSVIPTGPGAGIQRSRFVGVPSTARQATEPPETPAATREATPLFRDFTPVPEAGASSGTSYFSKPVAPQPFGRILPPVPLFHEETPAPEDAIDGYLGALEDGDDEVGTSELVQFSQSLNRGGTRSSGMEAGNEGDDDDLDVFRADADESR